MKIDYSNSSGGYETTLSLVNDTNEATTTAMRDAEQPTSLKSAAATREPLAGVAKADEEADGAAASSRLRLAIKPRSAPKRSQRQSQSQNETLLPQNLVMLKTAVATRTTTDDNDNDS